MNLIFLKVDVVAAAEEVGSATSCRCESETCSTSNSEKAAGDKMVTGQEHPPIRFVLRKD